MKKIIAIAVLFLFAGSISVMAQGGGGGRRTVEERVKFAHQKIDSAFKLDAAKLAQADSAFATYYRATDKVREELVSASGGGRPDFQAMREKTQPYADARDKELKAILGDDNYKKWKDEIEPTMRRGGGGGNRNSN
jgi:periplasmic protein CpxP/Spy